MSGDLPGRLGDLLLSAWIGTTPDGSEAVYLLLTTTAPSASVTMPMVAEALGLDSTPGAVTLQVDPARTWLTVAPDRWISLYTGGRMVVTALLPAEGCDLIERQRRAVLVVGYRPMPAGITGEWYVERSPRQTVLGIIPAQVERGDIDA